MSTTIDSTIPAGTGGMTAADTGAARAPKAVLDQGDFLKLLTVQLSQQDPLKPVEDQAFIAQMAQFSSLEQMNTLTREFAEMRLNQQLTSAGALIGREVTVTTEDGDVTGEVEAVNANDEGTTIVIGGVAYDMSAVRRITQPSAPVSTDHS